MAGAFTLAVAEMHPGPPSPRPSSSQASEPGHTANPSMPKKAAVVPQSPDESLMPTTVSGWASWRRRTTSTGQPTPATWGMW